MRTSKTISTVSYNTIPFLYGKLIRLVHNHTIEYFQFIKHIKEEDEEKDHIHLMVIPNVMIDTMDLTELLTEIDPNDPERPLKCIRWRKSKEDDWLLYNIHDPDYLASKGESRIYHYHKDDFCYSDKDNFDFFFHHAYYHSDWSQNNEILKHLRDDDVSPADLILSGMISFTQSSQINALSHMIDKYGSTYRGRHKKHD